MRRIVAIATALLTALAVAVVASPAGAEHASAPAGPGRDVAQRLSLGHGTACVILDNGNARCWGSNNQGQAGAQLTATPLGRDESPDLIPTVDVGVGRTVEEIDSGQGHACALLDNATVRCWGGASNGQLGDPGVTGRIGDGESPASIDPVRLSGTPTALSVGRFSACVILSTGNIQCWGDNTSGVLGTGTTEDIGDDEEVNSVPPIDLGAPATAITIGRYHACAILEGGAIRCWGAPQALPTGSTGGAAATANPNFTLGGKAATAISATNWATCAIDEDQDVWCWGDGTVARTSTGTNDFLDDPTPVGLGGRKIVAIDLGDEHACVIDTNGEVLCWGRLDNGRLGYGRTNFGQPSFVSIGDDEPPTAGGSIDVGGRKAKAVSAGFKGTCVILDNDTVRCWGDNGEIGAGQGPDLGNIGDDEKPTAIPPVNYVGTAAFKALDTPARVLETRTQFPGPAPVQGKGIVPPGGTIDVQITGVGGVPAQDVYAVVLNVTIANSTGPGFVTAYAAGTTRPTASNINVNGPGEVAPNSVIVPLSPDGKVSLFTFGGGHLIADVFGYFEPTASSTDGRFVGVTPARVFDTRPGPQFPPAGNKGKLGDGDTIEIKMTGANGVPNTGVSAVVLNVTAARADGPGFVTVYPGNVPQPPTSNINLAGPGATRPNTVIVPVSPTGTVKFFTLRGADLLADVTGYFTDESATDTDDGLFVRLNPARLLDSRSPNPAPIPAGGETSFQVTGLLGIPDTANAGVFNFTAVNGLGPGFVTAWPSDQERGDTSSVNVPGAGVVIANLGIIPLTQPSGSVSLFTLTGTNMIADTSGYFL